MGILAKITGKSLALKQASSKLKSTALYRGVQITPGIEGCCSEAKEATSHRYLSHEIPRLPFASCDFVNCLCTYELFDDRRSDLRRASDIGFDITSSLRTDVDLRRETSDRRKAS